MRVLKHNYIYIFFFNLAVIYVYFKRKYKQFIYIYHILLHIVPILAVIFVHIKTFLKLINHPEINCNMSIPSYHYFSNNISFVVFQAVA